jgi:nanoRNase/pAp phosphatase (c-di-AMP/oligoRNAs hydrolase)
MQETTQIITNSKNIYLIPSQEPEAITAVLALFYTLKDLGKNVNLILENLPENMNFLSPSLDFISYPKNLIISIPNKVAGISQIYYEKNDEALKIHLTLEKGSVKKENISFYYSEPKPDLIITVGIKDYASQLSEKLNSFGFLLDSPILNIDNEKDNKIFGKINLLQNSSVIEIVSGVIKDINQKPIQKNTATCLLSGLVIYTENFKKKITPEIFETAGLLMRGGADLKEILENVKMT